MEFDIPTYVISLSVFDVCFIFSVFNSPVSLFKVHIPHLLIIVICKLISKHFLHLNISQHIWDQIYVMIGPPHPEEDVLDPFMILDRVNFLF